MASPVDCLDAVQKALDRWEVKPGTITHTVEQIRQALLLEEQGFEVRLEKRAKIRRNEFQLIENKLEFAASRIPDIIATRAGERIHNEVKTSPNLKDALNLKQLTEDAGLALMYNAKNFWTLSAVKFEDGALEIFQETMDDLVNSLRSKGLTKTQTAAALESFKFTVDDAMEIVFGKNGKVAVAAKKAAGNSPDFDPAMWVLFGPDGKIASAASDAARKAAIKPELTGLEKKIEVGVASALDQAAEKAEVKTKEKEKKPLGEKVTEGIGALGKATSAIPELYESVGKLGEAWDKPLNSTEAYMNLLTAAGGTISQAGDSLEALSGLTKVATAVQGAFNAVLALNPITLIVLGVVALIAVIALLIIYWDEVKLAFLKAANFMSIQIQRIGLFFVGLRTLAGQVWDWITATATNVGITILNAFIKAGTDIQNFFIDTINAIIEQYNKLADTTFGEFVGLTKIETLAKVDVKTREIALREVPKIDVGGAFAGVLSKPLTGGLEGAIASTEAKIAKIAKEAEEKKKAGEEQKKATPESPPALTSPGAAAPTPGAAASGDRSVTVNGGITVNIAAERLEADAAKLLSDEIVAQLQRKLAALQSQQDFRTGTRVVSA